MIQEHKATPPVVPVVGKKAGPAVIVCSTFVVWSTSIAAGLSMLSRLCIGSKFGNDGGAKFESEGPVGGLAPSLEGITSGSSLRILDGGLLLEEIELLEVPVDCAPSERPAGVMVSPPPGAPPL